MSRWFRPENAPATIVFTFAFTFVFSFVLISVARCTPTSALAPDENHGELLPRDKTVRPAGPSPSPRVAVLDCAGAIELAVGDVVNGDNSQLPDGVSVYGCSPWNETGGEVVYHLVVPDPVVFEITVEASCDVDVAVLDACDPIGGCLIVGDTGVRTLLATSGEFFVVVDGYNGAGCPFTLSVQEVPAPSVDPAACAGATPLSCENGPLAGNTCGNPDFVQSLGCTTFVEEGHEDWYSVRLYSEGAFHADVVMPDGDVALWLLEGCGENPVCIAFVDEGLEGESEEIALYNPDGERTIYLVVDAFGPGACGDYTAQISCIGGEVPVVPSTWTEIKHRFDRGTASAERRKP